MTVGSGSMIGIDHYVRVAVSIVGSVLRGQAVDVSVSRSECPCLISEDYVPDDWPVPDRSIIDFLACYSCSDESIHMCLPKIVDEVNRSMKIGFEYFFLYVFLHEYCHAATQRLRLESTRGDFGCDCGLLRDYLDLCMRVPGEHPCLSMCAINADLPFVLHVDEALCEYLSLRALLSGELDVLGHRLPIPSSLLPGNRADLEDLVARLSALVSFPPYAYFRELFARPELFGRGVEERFASLVGAAMMMRGYGSELSSVSTLRLGLLGSRCRGVAMRSLGPLLRSVVIHI